MLLIRAFTELPKRAPIDDMTDLLPWNVDLREADKPLPISEVLPTDNFQIVNH